MSMQHQFETSTDVDPVEQKHNSMNLALGKPTQQFRQKAVLVLGVKNIGQQLVLGSHRGGKTQKLKEFQKSEMRGKYTHSVD